MIDRNLRTLDMRHTLPNLKNLVLTITHGEVVMGKLVTNLSPFMVIFLTVHSRKFNSPAMSMLGLDSPSEPELSADVGSVTPKGRKLSLEECSDTSLEAPAGNSTMPTALEEKKLRPFLGLSFPDFDFLRGRYPSASRESINGNLEGVRSQVPVSGLNGSEGLGASEAYGDRVDHSKPLPEELENRRQYEREIDHDSDPASIHNDTYPCT